MRIGIFLLAFLTGLGLVSLREPDFQLPSQEQISEWNESLLSKKDLLAKLTPEQCNSSEKDFMACVAALDKISFDLGVEIDPVSLKLITNHDHYFIQSNHFKKWINQYKNHASINFQELTDKLIYQNLDIKYHKWVTAKGINGWLSVKYDPHSYVKPIEDLDIEDIDEDPLFHHNDSAPILATPELKPEQQISFNPVYNYPKIVSSSISHNPELFSIINIESFDENSCVQFKEHLKKVIRAKSDKLIIDLKNNPGGLISEVSCIASTLVGPKPIVKLKPFSGKSELIKGNSPQLYFGEIQIFLDNQSASASEILAGALQVYNRATIVGDISYGKGTYQDQEDDWSDKNVIFMKTQGYYFLPNGKSPQIIGIKPDKHLNQKSGGREKDLFSYPLPSPPESPFMEAED